MSIQNNPPKNEKEDGEDPWTIAGLAIPGGVLLGMGVGFLTDELVAGLFIGLGSGFFVMMLIYAWLRRGGASR